MTSDLGSAEISTIDIQLAQAEAGVLVAEKFVLQHVGRRL